MLEKEGKTKIEKCNHPTPEAYNSWQEVLKKEGRDEIKNVTILHLRSSIPCRKCSNGDEIDLCNHPTPEALNSMQKLFKKNVKIKGPDNPTCYQLL